jgi:hypothetical protein
MEIVPSKNGVPIRLTDERWLHIVENHDELASYHDDVLAVVEDPEWITRGLRGSLIAWRSYGRRGFLCVHYRELSGDDGFVITAYLKRRATKEPKVWPK